MKRHLTEREFIEYQFELASDVQMEEIAGHLRGCAQCRQRLEQLKRKFEALELLREEFLVPMGLSQYRLAKEIDVPAQRISEIVAGKRYYDYDTSISDVVQRLESEPEPRRGLEVGCGTGRLIVPLARIPGLTAAAVDIDPEMLAATRRLAASHDLDLQIEKATALDFRAVEGGYDAIVFHGAALSVAVSLSGEIVVDASDSAERRAVVAHAAKRLSVDGSLGILIESDRDLEFGLSGGMRYVRTVESAGNPARRTHSVYHGEELVTRLQIERERCPLAVFERELQNSGLAPEPINPESVLHWSRRCEQRR